MNFKLIYYNIFWIIIISLLGKFIYNLELDLYAPFDYGIIFKFIILFFLIVIYSLFYNKYKTAYNISKEKDILNNEKIKNEVREKSNDTVTARKEWKSFLKDEFNNKNYFLLVVSIILLFLYLYSHSIVS